MSSHIAFNSVLSFLAIIRSVAGGDSPPPPNGRVVDLMGIDLFSCISPTFRDPTTGYVGPNGVAGWDSVQFEVRNITGTGNNLQNPLQGAAHQPTRHCTRSEYGDGFSSFAGATRRGARDISNQVFGSVSNVANDRGLTQFAWQWGQFIDHDVTFIPGSTMEAFPIPIPPADPVFGNSALGNLIAFSRSPAAPNTGVTTPRLQVNDLTAFVDGSVVYGHEEARASALRLNERGLLKTQGNPEFGILPRNTLTPPLENEPELEPVHMPETLGVAGDPRPNEQIGLYNMHTILVRLHNQLARIVREWVDDEERYDDVSPSAEDEIVYQYTKLIVTAIIQKITYKDWLPALFGEIATNNFLGSWTEYVPQLDPTICIEFATAAFRFGHTMLPNTIPLRNADCSPWVDATGQCTICSSQLQGVAMRDAFFAGGVFEIPGFIEAAMNGFHCTLAGEVDLSIVDGVRDFLFQNARVINGQQVFATELDLVALNLQRGREHGLVDYNELRLLSALQPRTSVAEISSDPLVQQLLQGVTGGNVNDIDAFVGLLAEDHLPGGSFGETMSRVVLDQFRTLRDGDRFWYENYLAAGSPLRLFVESWTLDDIVRETAISEEMLYTPTGNAFVNIQALSNA